MHSLTQNYCRTIYPALFVYYESGNFLSEIFSCFYFLFNLKWLSNTFRSCYFKDVLTNSVSTFTVHYLLTATESCSLSE